MVNGGYHMLRSLRNIWAIFAWNSRARWRGVKAKFYFWRQDFKKRE